MFLALSEKWGSRGGAWFRLPSSISLSTTIYRSIFFNNLTDLKSNLFYLYINGTNLIKRVLIINIRLQNTVNSQVQNSQSQEGIYEGQYKNSLKHGDGKMTYANGFVYEGQWWEKYNDRLNDQKHGQGVFITKDDAMYEG